MAERKVLVELGAKLSPAAQKTFAKMSNRIKKLGKEAREAINFRTVGAAAGAFAAAGAAIVALTKRTADAGDELAKMSKRTGLTVEFLAGLKHAAGLSGTSIEAMEKGMKTMAMSAATAADGLTSYTREFDKLGVTVTDTNGDLKAPEVLFREITTALSKMENQTQKAAIASRIFGRAGTQLLPMLVDGEAGINAMIKESKELGNVWTNETAKGAEDLNDALLRAETVISNIGQAFAVELIPEIEKATNSFVDWFKVNKDVISADVKDWAETAANAVSMMVDSVRGAVDIFNELRPALSFIADTMGMIRDNSVAGMAVDYLAEAAGASAQEKRNTAANFRQFESPEAQERLRRLRERIRGETDAERRGEADAARERAIADEAVDAYKAGRDKERERAIAQRRAVRGAAGATR